MRRAAKIDRTQPAIIAALTQAGYIVCDLSRIGGGCPDLLVSGVDRTTGRPANWLLECKTGRGKLNTLQQAWHASWRGPIATVRSVDEALAAVGATT